MSLNMRSKPLVQAAGTAPGLPPAGRRSSVLVIEDDPTLLLTLSYNLRRNGFNVVEAKDGYAGLEAVRANPDLDAVVLDLMLPGISGLQVLRMLRASSDVSVLILSARGEEQDKIDGLELGADDFVVKPFAMRELVARLRAALRRHAIPGARPPSVLERGAILIEPDRRRVVVNGEEVALRPKEFGLLMTLAIEPGRLFGRQELLDKVWGEDIIVDERTVDVHISWLRGKLGGACGQADAIRTIYGAGYCFQSPPSRDALSSANGWGLDGDGSGSHFAEDRVL